MTERCAPPLPPPQIARERCAASGDDAKRASAQKVLEAADAEAQRGRPLPPASCFFVAKCDPTSLPASRRLDGAPTEHLTGR